MEYELYPKNGDELFESYKKFSKHVGAEYDDNLILESIERTDDILKNRIENYDIDTAIKLPSFVVPEGSTADDTLNKLAVEGLINKKLHDNSEYTSRLKEELSIIKDRKFSKYFLTMNKIAYEAKERQLCGGGRGSSSGALLAYVLGITDLDPIKYKLQFSRFIRKTDTSIPDIDFDCSSPMVLKEELAKLWGENTVIPISNYNTLQIKSLIKDISKLNNIPYEEVNQVTNKMILEATPQAKIDNDITAGVYEPTFEELKKYSYTLQAYLQKYPHVATYVENLYGEKKSISRHAGGIIVLDKLNEQMPLIKSGGVIQTPWTEGMAVRNLEPLGFIKFDILGLSSLVMIEDCIRHILKRKHGMKDPQFADIKKYYYENLTDGTLDTNDIEVYKNVFWNKNYCSTFQFTNSGAQDLAANAKPRSIEDLSVLTSIYRPGPLSANVDKEYIEVMNSEREHYDHSLLKDVLKDTKGFLIFQESIPAIVNKLGKDISLDEGNELRKVLTKKGTGKEQEVKDRIYKKYVDGCIEKGVDKKTYDLIWFKMAKFATYAFSRNHAIPYSFITYVCAYLWTKHPAEWAAAFLEREPEAKKSAAMSTVKKANFSIKGIDINSSSNAWEISDDGKTLIQPLSSIKGLGDVAIKQLIEHRPFKTVEELLFHKKMLYNKVNKKSLDVLTRTGALDNLIDKRFTGAKHFWSACVVDRPKTEKALLENIEKYKPEGEFTSEEKLENMVSLSGIYPLELVIDDNTIKQLEDKCIPPISQFDPDLGVAWGIIREITEKKTKNGKIYLVINLIDSTNALTTLKVWSFRKDKDKIWLNKAYMIKAKKDDWGLSTSHCGSLKLLN